MDTINQALSCLELFQDLTPGQLREIGRNAERTIYQPGDVLIAHDEICDAAILLIDGEAIALRGSDDEPIEEMVAAGVLLAEMAMVVEIEASSTVVARTRIRALKITRDGILNQLERDPSLAQGLMDVIVGRLRHVAGKLQALEGTLTGAEGSSGGELGAMSNPRSQSDIELMSAPQHASVSQTVSTLLN